MTEPPAESRTVVVIRHAHAGDGAAAGGPGDHGRELDGRGRREAVAAGRWLSEQRFGFDLVLVSDAARTRQTWTLIAEQLTDPREPTIEPRIYDGNVDELVNLLAEDRARVPVLAIVGHNPAVSELARHLSATDGVDRVDLVPGAIVVIDVGPERIGCTESRIAGRYTPDSHRRR